MIVVSFLLGLIAGVAGTILYASYRVRKLNKEQDKEVDNMLEEIKLINSIKARYTKITEITDRQMDLLAGAERPSASALHSKHQNGIVGELKKLEEEKVTIFRSILKDGIDPNLSIMVDGKPTTMKMSEAVSMYESNQQKVEKTDSKSPRVKLRLVTSEEENVGLQKEEKGSSPT